MIVDVLSNQTVLGIYRFVIVKMYHMQILGSATETQFQ